MGKLKKISSEHMTKRRQQQTNGVKCKSTNQSFKKTYGKEKQKIWGAEEMDQGCLLSKHEDLSFNP